MLPPNVSPNLHMESNPKLPQIPNTKFLIKLAAFPLPCSVCKARMDALLGFLLLLAQWAGVGASGRPWGGWEEAGVGYCEGRTVRGVCQGKLSVSHPMIK